MAALPGNRLAEETWAFDSLPKSVAHPARAFVTEVEGVWMKGFCQDFQGFDDARAGSVEELVAVGYEDAVFENCCEFFIARFVAQHRHFLERSLDVETAGANDDDVGIFDNQLLPIHPR